MDIFTSIWNIHWIWAQECFSVNTTCNIFLHFLSGLPVVSITYSAQWNFPEYLPSNCSNISARLDDLEEETGEIFANRCQLLGEINATVQFNYCFLANAVNIHAPSFALIYTSLLIWLYLQYQSLSHINS